MEFVDRKKHPMVGITLWDREGRLTSKKKKSITFTVQDTTMEDMAEFIKEAVTKASK